MRQPNYIGCRVLYLYTIKERMWKILRFSSEMCSIMYALLANASRAYTQCLTPLFQFQKPMQHSGYLCAGGAALRVNGIAALAVYNSELI